MEKQSRKFPVWLLVVVLIAGYWVLDRALPPKQPQPVDMADRVYMLSQTWHMAANVYGYFELLPENFDWDAAYYEALEEVMEGGSDYDFYCALERFSAKLMDGHTRVTAGDGRIVGYLPAKFAYIEGNYMLVASSSALVDVQGWWLAEIEGEPADRYIAREIAPLVGVQTPLAREQRIALRLTQGPLGGELALTFESAEGERRSHTVAFGGNEMTGNATIYRSTRGALYNSNRLAVDILRGNIAHVQIASFSSSRVVDEFYESVAPLIEDCDGVILDIRGNTGGNSTHVQKILEAFADDPVTYPFTRAVQLKTADGMRVGGNITYPEERQRLTSMNPEMLARYEASAEGQRGRLMLRNRYYIYSDPERNDDFGRAVQGAIVGTGPMVAVYERHELYRRLDLPCVMLIDHTALSASDMAADMAQMMGITTIGTHTMGANGTNFFLPLGGGWTVSFTSERAFRHDGSDYWNVGVPADIYVEQTIEDARTGVDTQLEAALDIFG